jgi:hypothetical protein
LPLGSELFNLVQAGFDCEAWKAASNRTVRISLCVNINDIVRPDLRMLGKVAGGNIAWMAIESTQRAIDKFDTRTTEGEEGTAGKEVESKQGAPSSMA